MSLTPRAVLVHRRTELDELVALRGTDRGDRGRYLASLRRADREDDLGELIAFART